MIPWTDTTWQFFAVLGEGARATRLFWDSFRPASTRDSHQDLHERHKGLEGWFMGVAWAYGLETGHQELVMRNIHASFPDIGR